jgi:hypothetical protein
MGPLNRASAVPAIENISNIRIDPMTRSRTEHDRLVTAPGHLALLEDMLEQRA